MPSRLYRSIALAGVVVAFSYPLLATVQEGMSASPRETSSQRFAYVKDALQQYTAPSDIVLSDRPQVVAWYGDRTSIHIPYTLSDLYRIDKEYIRVDAILITEDVLERYSAAPEWQEVLTGEKDIPGFRLVWRYEEGARKLLLYRRAT